MTFTEKKTKAKDIFTEWAFQIHLLPNTHIKLLIF